MNLIFIIINIEIGKKDTHSTVIVMSVTLYFTSSMVMMLGYEN